MQQLGLSPNAPKTQSRLRELLWPDVSDEVSAETAARNGMYAAFAVATVTALLALVQWIPRASLVDGVLFLCIGFGIRKMSRTAAVAGLVLYVVEQGYAFFQGRGGWNVVLLVILTALFLSAARATFSYHRLKKRPGPDAAPEVPGS